MRSSMLWNLTVLFWSAQIVAGKRGSGGGWGSSGGSSGGSSSGGSSGSSGGGSSSGGSSGSGTSSAPPPKCSGWSCVCNMIDERQDIYELPGLYYNGTVKVTHQLSHNSAWDAEALNPSQSAMCANSDSATKSYSYPALFFVGPTANRSDYNPLFWILRGFAPLEWMTQDQYLDVKYKNIYIRSADTMVTDTSLKGSIFGQYQYYETSALRTRNSNTEVYWDTDVIQTSGTTYSATAKYNRSPNETSYGQGSGSVSGFPVDQGAKPRTSQYVMLQDVCYYNQQPFGTGSVPRSKIPLGNTYTWTTAPFIWFDRGTEATINNIGGETLTFTMNNSFTDHYGLVTRVEPNCADQTGKTYQNNSPDRNAFPLHWSKSSDFKVENVWNLTGTLSLSFEGTLVQENSTTITGFDNGTPQFLEQYERVYNQTPAGSNKSEARMGNRGSAPLLACSLLFTLLSWLL